MKKEKKNPKRMNITSALLDWMFSTVWCFDVAVCHVFFCWNEPNLRSITVKIVTGKLLKKKKTFCQHSYILMYCNNCSYSCDSKWHLWLARHLPLSLICLILLFLANVVQHLSSTLSCDCQTLKIGSWPKVLALLGKCSQDSLHPHLKAIPLCWIPIPPPPSMRKRHRKRGTCGGHLAKLRLDFLPSQQSSLHSSIFSMNPGAMMWTLRTPGWFPLLARSRGALFNPCLFAICVGRERLYPTFDLWLRLLLQGKSPTQLPSGWV